ncbi:glycosyltransferase family 4 protein [Luteimicrobium sp. NPDC057192]|uniref:glycosyltransferase family 4 protein n=1 Tax=Luteimicrobium sp. NPDC057192 TaxID=3346042 RepID=UPI0036408E5C
MRVLHVVDSDAFAGVERHVARLARAQAAAGDRVHVLGGAVDAMRAEAGPRVAVEPVQGLRTTARAVARLGCTADVVHVHMTAAEVAASLAGPLAALRGRRLAPVVATRHFARPRGSGRLGPLTAAIARRPVRAQLAISAYVAAHVDGASVVVSPGVDTAGDAPPASDRASVVLLAQRLEAEKDGDVALRAFAASGLAAGGWELHVAGDGALRADLEDLAMRLGIGAATRFLGHRADVPDLLDHAALLLAPCRIEGLGLSVLEAMARGLPVVAADAGGHTELLQGLHGACLVAPGDPDDAARALRVLAADPAARDAYGAAEQQRQRHTFTLENQVRHTEAVYRTVL